MHSTIKQIYLHSQRELRLNIPNLQLHSGGRLRLFPQLKHLSAFCKHALQIDEHSIILL